MGSDAGESAEERHQRMMLEFLSRSTKKLFPDIDVFEGKDHSFLAVRPEDRRAVQIAHEQYQQVEDDNAAMEKYARDYMMAELKWKHRTSDDEELERKWPEEVAAIRNWRMPEEQKEVPRQAIHTLKVAQKNALPWLFERFALGRKRVKKGEVVLERDE